MAYKAFSKINNALYSVDEWLENNYNEIPYCPICGEITTIDSKTSEFKRTHFSHSKGALCPSIEKNRELYALLIPKERDMENAKELKNWFKANPYILYNACKKILNEHLSYKEFSEIIRVGNEKQIWSLKGLNEVRLPYVLMVNYGIFDITPTRTDKCYFIFDKDLNGKDLFLTEKIKHIWKIDLKDKDFTKIEISNLVTGSSKSYFWNYVKEFYK